MAPNERRIWQGEKQVRGTDAVLSYLKSIPGIQFKLTPVPYVDGKPPMDRQPVLFDKIHLDPTVQYALELADRQPYIKTLQTDVNPPDGKKAWYWLQKNETKYLLTDDLDGRPLTIHGMAVIWDMDLNFSIPYTMTGIVMGIRTYDWSTQGHSNYVAGSLAHEQGIMEIPFIIKNTDATRRVIVNGPIEVPRGCQAYIACTESSLSTGHYIQPIIWGMVG